MRQESERVEEESCANLFLVRLSSREMGEGERERERERSLRERERGENEE